MQLDPQIADVIDRVRRANRPQFNELGPIAARASYARAAKVLDIAPAPLARIDDFSMRCRDGSLLPLRIYVPRVGAGILPVLVFFHGGGFTIGSIATHDAICRMLARDADCMVVSVEYRLAPEFPFPAAVNDAFEAIQWVRGNARRLGADAQRIAFGGDSAGGTLAAVSAIRARDDHWKPVLQLLIYPGLGANQDTDSHRRLAEGYMMDATLIQWFFGHYLRSAAERRDWRFSPLDAEPPVNLVGVAPAVILVAGFDPLHDEGVAYADRLRAAGVAVELLEYPGMVHGFFNFGGAIDVARGAHRDAAAALRHAFLEAA